MLWNPLFRSPRSVGGSSKPVCKVLLVESTARGRRLYQAEKPSDIGE